MKLRIALIQMQVEMGNPERNFAHAKEMMEEAMERKPDILVLPETWNTGFFPRENLADLADKEGKETSRLLSETASRYAVNIVGGSTAVQEGNDIYNRSMVFDRKGDLVSTYDKMHGFSLSGEPGYFRMGNHLSHFTLDGIECSMAICYDIRRSGPVLRPCGLAEDSERPLGPPEPGPGHREPVLPGRREPGRPFRGYGLRRRIPASRPLG